MGKRVTIILLALLVSGLAIMGYFFQQGRKNLFTDPYKAISPGACIVIETVDLQSFMNSLTTGKGLFGEAGKIKEFDNFIRKLKYLTDQLNKAGFKKLLDDGSSIISFHPTKEGKLQSLLSMTVPGEIRYRQIKEVLRSSGIKEVIESKLNGNLVLKIPFAVNSQKDTAYISLISGLMLCSSSKELLEEARVQMGREKDVRNLPGFSRVLLASGKNEDKIFVVFANLHRLFKSVLGKDVQGVATKITKLAGTAGGDIYINEDGLVLSGYTESPDSSEFLYRYKFILPREFHTYKILPSSTVIFETLVLSAESPVSKSDSTVSQVAVGLAVKLKEYTGEEITRAYIDIKERPVGDNTLILYELSNRVQAVGYQFASSNGMIYNSLSIRFKEVTREESTTEWETLLDTIAGIKPFFFTNHTTGAKEIFIQDMKNNTYLINAAGRVLWKVSLNERIIGTIYMIDYFRNGKYQLMFSGKNYIHLLDRNGNYVERYPVKLRSPATNSLALFDYDNNLNYRLFIAGEDKMIYSYDKTRNVVKGWNPFRTTGYVKAGISYFKVSGKDYLVASDENSVYFLDRAGNKRVNLKESVTKASRSAMRLNPGSEPSVVCTSPDGTVQHIYFDGSIKKFSLKKFSGDHSFDNFDVDGDGFGEYIFIDKGMLYLYDHNRSEMFSRDFGSIDLWGPISFIFSGSDRKIGVFDINKKQIYLIGIKGETMNGFPLRGASMFSIGKLSDKSGWHLIVGGTDKFLYNYKIDTEIK
ncbi:MAG: hypothetical protein Q8N38_11225 [Bacteroidales bacterium]|nr:hypothetical protein [Bacteroidales bacterium]